MLRLPLAARLYVAIIVTLGACLLTAFFPVQGLQNPPLFVVLLVISCLTSIFKVKLPLSKSGSTMSVSHAVDFAALLLIGPQEAMLVASVSAFCRCTFRMPLYRTLFNMASLTVSVLAAGKVYELLGGVTGDLYSLVDVAGPLLGAAMTYFMINTVTVAAVIAWTTGQRLPDVWHQNFLWSAPSYFVGAAAAVVASAAMRQSGFALVFLAAVPLYLTYRTYKVYLGRIHDEQKNVQQASDLHLATVEALARAIDAKDQLSQGHIRRVQTYAVSLARAAGMSEPEVKGVETAAVLHDIGKLAVPEHILSKPGPLTQEEFQKIRIHPKVGADIIEAVPFPYPVAPLILSHHERWDGKGYPAGLKGTDIPLGARVLSVVDYFDAMMTERPYHKAMGYDAALGLLQEESGKGLDPRLVEQFIGLLPMLRTQMRDEAAATASKLAAMKSAAGDPLMDVGRRAALRPAAAQPSVFEDIALAHREIYALYDIAQALGSSLGIADTMTLIASKLSNLVPFSCCALFLYDDESDTLQCRFATGSDSEIVQQIGVHSGDGLTGWVAKNRRPLLNGRPSADLEAAGLVSLSMSLQSALVCPLVLNDRFIGTLAVYHLEEDFFSEDHRRLLDRVSEQTAAVINNSILFEQTQQDSLTDTLTSLPNTRFLKMYLTRELARAERLKSPISLLVMDIDNFKEINDTHGHHVGDLALCEVARVLRMTIRPYDVCVRYAGDEFIVVLSDCTAEEAERKRVELQNALQDLLVEARPGERLRLGVSIGAAVYPQDGVVEETLRATADRRMYQDKATRKRGARHSRRRDQESPALID